MGEERKIVTVLFADSVGSTQIGEQFDPEELATIMHAFFDEMRAAVENEGGVVEKYIGDAVMALFGVPSSHEDDPSRALRCALAMYERLDRLNGGLERVHGVRFGLRVGVNTGEVLVSDDPGADLGKITGDAVNVAARLEQFAEPGQIVVSARTARGARGFRFDELGPLSLKGKATPVYGYVLVAAEAGATPGATERGISGLSAPMVGRDQELALLQGVIERSATARRPHLVTVYGEAGVGKSRLVRELVAWADAGPEPVLVLRGRCLPYGDGVAYWPMAEILKHLAGVLDSDPPAEVLRKLHATGAALFEADPGADVARVIGGLAATAGIVEIGSPLSELSPHELRIEMHTAWRAALSRLASAGPVLVVVEDIHWADDALLDLLDDLADHTNGALVLVCPSRPELTARRRSWGRGRPNASAIGLEPLSLADTSRLTSLLLDVDDLPDSVRRRILERAEGNPFFLEEILRQLIDEGRIVRDGARWRAAPSAGDVRIPDSVQAVLAARIDLLPAVPKRLLQHAAVVGRVFWTGSLGQQATADLDGQLDLLEGRDLISTRLGSAFRGEPRCSFRHVLTRNVAYDSIPRRERARLHAQVAAWLDDVAAGREGEFAELLAHHWSQAHAGSGIGTADAELERRRQLAHRWCVAAARESHRRAVAERARTFAQRALDLAVTPDEVADAADALGRAHSLMGDGSPAMAAYRIGADALLDAGAPDPDRAAYFCVQVSEFVARWPGSLREPFDEREIRRYLDRGLELAGDRDSEVRARLLVVRSFWTWGARDGSLGDDATAAQRASDATTAADMAARLELADVESAALDALTACLGDDLRYYACNEVSDRRLRLLPRLHDDLERGDTLCLAAWTRFDLGAYAEAFELASQALDETDNRYWSTVLHALAWRSLSGLVLARWDSVLTDLGRASSILQSGGIHEPPPFASGTWAAASYVRAARREVDEANHLLGLLPTNTGEDGESASGGATVSLALARLQRLESARRRLHNADTGMVPALTLGCLAQLDVAEATGDWDDARAVILRRLKTPEAQGAPKPNRACADELAGREARAVGDLDAARSGLADVSAQWSDLGAIWPAARVDLALAGVLRALDDPAAAERAASALAVFEAVGVLDEIAEARALLAG